MQPLYVVSPKTLEYDPAAHKPQVGTVYEVLYYRWVQNAHEEVVLAYVPTGIQ